MNQLENKKILITGGTGFLGSHIVDRLLDEQVKHITIIDNMVRGSHRNIESAIKSEKLTVIEGDIKDLQQLDKLMTGIDYCFHMAAEILVLTKQWPKIFYKTTASQLIIQK